MNLAYNPQPILTINRRSLESTKEQLEKIKIVAENDLQTYMRKELTPINKDLKEIDLFKMRSSI